MGESGERLYLVHHGPFTVRVLGTPEGVHDTAIDYLIDWKYFGIDYSQPLALEHLEVHPNDELFRKLGAYTETALMSINPDGRPDPETEPARGCPRIPGQGKLFRLVTGSPEVTYVPEPNF